MSRKKLLRLVIIIFCLYLIVTTAKAIIDLWKAGDKLTQRQQNLSFLKKEQEDLLRQKAAIDNPNYWEEMARDRLGLSKPGEKVIVIPQELLVDQTPVASVDATPNWQKWAKLLF